MNKQLNRLFTILAVVAGIAVARYIPGNQVGEMALYLVITFVVVLPIHELGHAMAGALVGFRITSVIIGVGRPLLAFKILGVSVQINLLPLGGMTMGLPSGGARLLRLRHWIFIAGGPGAQVLIYFVLRRVFAAEFQDLRNHHLLSTAIWVNWSVMVLNLIPFRQADGQPSDGYGLFTIPFWSQAQIADALVRAEMSPAMLAGASGDHATARRLAEDVHRRHPEHPVPMMVLGNAMHGQRQHEAARALWREALARASEPRLAAILKNNIAFMSVISGRAEDLPEADRLSQEAMVTFPEERAIVGTRGAVLTRLGRAAEGLPLLERADAGAQGKTNQAYSKALIASALAALGRGREAQLKLIGARSLDPSNELIARAEADVAAGPLPAAATAPSPAGPDLVAQADALRRWRRDARIVAFAGLALMFQGFGSALLAPCLIVTFLSITPELAGVAALAACAIGGAALRAFGFFRSDLVPDKGLALAVPLMLAMGVAACWLIVRHRRLGPPAPSRVPAVLGWVLVGLGTLLMSPNILRLSFSSSALTLHRVSLGSSDAALLLISLAAVLVTRRRAWLRSLAVLPGAATVALAVFATSWFLDRIVLAHVPADGAPVTWSEARPITVRHSVTLHRSLQPVRMSPDGNAFLVGDVEPSQRDDAPRLLLRMGDFNGRVVQLEGSGGAFLDADRVMVVRSRPGPVRASELVELRPFADQTPAWTKPLPVALNGFVRIEVDRLTGDVYFWERYPDGDRVAAFHTTTASSTPVDAVEVRHRPGDDLVAHHLSPAGWAGMLVGRKSGSSTRDLWLRTPSGDSRIIATDWSRNCPQLPPGAPAIWCWLPGAVLVRIDAGTAAVTRIPGQVFAHEVAARSASRLVMLRHRELAIVDLDARRASRWTLPDVDDDVDLDLVEDGLATVARAFGSKEVKLVVYAEP